MKDKEESILSGVAAMLVLFTAMLDPMISVGLAVVLLVGYAGYKYVRSRK